YLGDQSLSFLELLQGNQQRAVNPGTADRLDQMGVGAMRHGPFDSSWGFRTDQRHQRHGCLALLPGELLVAGHVDVEEEKVRFPHILGKPRPYRLSVEANGRQLTQQGSDIGM